MRLTNQSTIKNLGERTPNFRIYHPLVTIKKGSYHTRGIKGSAKMHIGLDYSYDGRLMAGIGRSSYITKLYDGFLKYRLLRQTDDGKMPASVTLFTSAVYSAQKDAKTPSGQDKYFYASDRFSFAHAIMVGR